MVYSHLCWQCSNKNRKCREHIYTYIHIYNQGWPAAMRGTSSRNKTEILWILLKCIFPIKGEASLYSRDESQTWGWTMDQDLGEVKHNDVWNFQDVDNVHQIVPNQSEFGLESVSCKINFFLSKPNWNWFGKLYAIFGCNFFKPNWIWFGKGHWMKCSLSTLFLFGKPTLR